MNKIFVTGSEGFIGSHLVESLLKSGFKIRALVYYNSFNNIGWLSNIKLNRNIEIIPGDIRDYNFLKNSIKNCETIIHLAALIGIPYSYEAPQSYVDTNIVGTLNLLQAAKELKIKKIISTSTSEVYGNAKTLPIFEDHINYAQSPYAASKISADQFCNAFYSSYNLPVTIIRPFNTFGPRQSARAIIPTIITQILNGQTKIKVGNIYAKRDFNYIDDLISAYFAILNSKKTVGQTINIGNNFYISIKDLASLIAKIMNVKISFDVDKKRIRPKRSEVNSLLASNEKAKKILNWKPKFLKEIGLIKGLKITINWFKDKKNLDYYNYKLYNK
jgi:dTDP-glucose 4,6-dehydratase